MHPHPGARGCEVFPGNDADTRRPHCIVERSNDNHRTKVFAFLERLGEQIQAIGGCDQNAHIAVFQDVRYLCCLEHWIDRYEYASGGGDTEQCGHGFRAFLQVDRDAIMTRESQPQHCLGGLVYAFRQGPVAHTFSAVRERLVFRHLVRGQVYQFVQERCHRL